MRSGLFILLLLCAMLLAHNAWSFSQGPNNRNVSVDTQVNVTGSAPEILSVSLPSSITLIPGGLYGAACNLSIRDYNGFADIDTVNGTLFSTSQSSLAAADDNSTHYTNASCAPIPGQQNGAFANYTCSFPLNYYAVNDTWNCTALVNDTIDLQGNASNTTVLNELLALNVTTLIDYGDLAMGDTSSDQEANVSNLGNRPINVSVRGYAQALGDGLGFACEQGTLSVDLQHFASNNTSAYADKQALAASPLQVAGLTIPKAADFTGSENSTYWQLYLDPSQNVFGLCNGTIVFQAEGS